MQDDASERTACTIFDLHKMKESKERHFKGDLKVNQTLRQIN